MLGDSTVYSRVHALQPGTRKPFFFDKNIPDADWSIKERHTPFTMHHPMHLPTKTDVPSTYMPCTFQQPSLVPRLFFRNQTTMHLLIFSTYYDVAKLKKKYYLGNINVAHLSLVQWCCLGNRLCSSYIPPWVGVLLFIGVIGIQLPSLFE